MSDPNVLSDAARDRLLDGIARGLQRLDASDRSRFNGGVNVQLCHVSVALLDSDGEALRVAPLADVLGWVVGRQWADVGARDTCLGSAHDAHVLDAREQCAERGCGERHVDPCPEGAGDDEDASGGRRGTIEHTVNGLSRGRIMALLESASIQCYDHESDAELREALVENVLDGTIEESALHEGGP